VSSKTLKTERFVAVIGSRGEERLTTAESGTSVMESHAGAVDRQSIL